MMHFELTQAEIKHLIVKYTSELRELEFQLRTTQEIIWDLQRKLKGESDMSFPSRREEGRMESIDKSITADSQSLARDSFSSSPKKRRGRPKKTEMEMEFDNSSTLERIKAKRGMSRKEEHEDSFALGHRSLGGSKGYRLSDWDKFIIECLVQAQMPLINSDFMELAFERNRNSNEVLPEDIVRGKLTRSIHKLANKRSEIVKINFSGKGFAYALPDWVNAKGNLKAKYQHLR